MKLLLLIITYINSRIIVRKVLIFLLLIKNKVIFAKVSIYLCRLVPFFLLMSTCENDFIKLPNLGLSYLQDNTHDCMIFRSNEMNICVLSKKKISNSGDWLMTFR